MISRHQYLPFCQPCSACWDSALSGLGFSFSFSSSSLLHSSLLSCSCCFFQFCFLRKFHLKKRYERLNHCVKFRVDVLSDHDQQRRPWSAELLVSNGTLQGLQHLLSLPQHIKSYEFQASHIIVEREVKWFGTWFSLSLAWLAFFGTI